ncbi:GDP-L-fucose synthase [Pseudobythopirellula maris]|uniref:GDP-L-fucose synthase n=1 Tax=Pseudobythopirellula maris TaxID=2527991 RepID=A0A5C5ZMX5_9BACT|nr:GDP-L-fucose synthase [Pseudobythopirellula maris]TWT88844.1 GDP-L-fucose synthase [Pseudobythopirellula maris]
MPSPIPRDAKVLVTGGRGMVGSALLRRFRAEGFANLLAPTRDEVDLRDQAAVDAWFDRQRPKVVVHAAGTVGGIEANRTRPAEFLYDNLMLHATVMRAAWRTGVRRLLYLGSSCVYPRDCPQPMREEHLLSGPLEPTNDAYAIAKIAGVKACDAYRRQHGCDFFAAMPTNLYGPGDNFDPQNSHVVAGMIQKFHTCRQQGSGRRSVALWGTGAPRRELMHVDDLADACLTLLDRYEGAGPVNVGVGVDTAVSELAEQVRSIVCPDATIDYDTTKPDGAPRKLLDVSRLESLGWRSRIPLADGLRSTYEWFLENEA